MKCKLNGCASSGTVSIFLSDVVVWNWIKAQAAEHHVDDMVVLFWGAPIVFFFASVVFLVLRMSSQQNKLQRERNQKQLLELVALPGNSE